MLEFEDSCSTSSYQAQLGLYILAVVVHVSVKKHV